MKNLRIFAALFLAFGSIFIVQPAHATALEQAQAALAAGQQEVIDAQAALASASAVVQVASESLAVAQAAYNDPSNSYTVASTVQTTTQNVVQNGTFDSTANWSNVVASNTVYTGGGSPIIINGTLKGSYTSGVFILQTGTFPAPTRQVQFSVDVWNYDTNEGNRANNPDYYRIEFRTYAADGSRLNYYNFQISQWHNWVTRGASYTFDRDAVTWDIGFRMADGGFWAGAFGPVMDNVVLNAVMTTGTPAYSVIDPVVVQELQSATQAYNQAVLARTAAQTRYDNAVAAIPALEAAVLDATPHLNAPTNLQAVLTDTEVELTWDAPASNSSGVVPERYAIMWSTTNFTENGWGWAHGDTSVTIPLDVLDDAGGLGNTFQFAIRADNDTLAIYSSRSTTVSVTTVAPPTPAWWQVQWNEGEYVEIGLLSEGNVFSSVTAWYGGSDGLCGATVSAVLEPLFIGNSTVSFTADNGLFGDPCPGTYKVLRVAATVTSQPQVSQSPEVVQTPTESPSPQPTPEPAPTQTPEPVAPPSVEPRPEPTPEPSPEPTPVEPEPTPSPEPEPSPTTTPEPTPTDTPEPEPTETPQPSPTPEPIPEEPEPAPTVDPTPEPSPEPKPEPEPEPKTPEDLTSDTPIEDVVAVLETVVPTSLTEEQVAVLVSIALETFETAEQGSPEYEAALDLLLVAAQADDIVLDEELAAIPLIGNVAGAAVEVFNALGNAGADMSPQVREQSEKVVIAAVIVGQVAMTAVASATSAASVAARRP